jgi:hypothetical protein
VEIAFPILNEQMCYIVLLKGAKVNMMRWFEATRTPQRAMGAPRKGDNKIILGPPLVGKRGLSVI